MAKDGTARGGPRPGTGPKKKPLAEKVQDGTADGAMVLPEPSEFTGEDIPPVKDYLKARQKNGKDFCAAEIYTETYKWLMARGCEKLVNNQLIEQYAMSVARWVACEESISEFGYLSKHPTTGNAISSPFVAMSREYFKQCSAAWYQIYQVVRDNCAVEFGGSSPQDLLMEKLLSARNK